MARFCLFTLPHALVAVPSLRGEKRGRVTRSPVVGKVLPVVGIYSMHPEHVSWIKAELCSVRDCTRYLVLLPKYPRYCRRPTQHEPSFDSQAKTNGRPVGAFD